MSFPRSLRNWRTTLSASRRAALLAVKISFLWPENVVISPSFVNNTFTGDRILEWSPLLSFNQHISGVFLLPPAPACTDGKSVEVLVIATMHGMCHFSLAAIKIFSLPLVFSTSTMMCLGGIFFVFVRGGHWPSQICPRMSSQDGNWHTFSCLSPLSLLFFWDSNATGARPPDVALWVPGTPLSF